MKKLDRVEIFEKMPVRRAVLKQIVPAILAQMIAMIYSLADSFFVGMLNTPKETAAVAVAIPLYISVEVIANLFGVGGASVLAQTLGRRQHEKIGRISSITFWFSMFGTIAYALIILFFMKPLVFLAGGTSDTYEIVRQYLIWTAVLGGPGTILGISCANLVRAEGNASVASFGLSLGAVLNIVLDPVFVLPQFLGMGAAGAGLATGISNTIGFLFFLGYILFSKTSILDLNPKLLKYTGDHLKEIVMIGLPSAIQYVLIVVSAAALTKFVSRYPTEAVAGVGISRRLAEVPLYFSIGVATGLLPLLAYNYGSGNHERRRAAFRFGCCISIGISVIFLAAFEIWAARFAGLFINEPVTIGYASRFLRMQILAQPLVAFNYPMVMQFQAMGEVRASLICSVLRKGVLDIPLMFLAERIWPLYGLMLVQVTVDLIAFVVAMCFYVRLLHRQKTN